MLQMKALTVGELSTCCYIVYDDASDGCVVIDPGYEPERIRKACGLLLSTDWTLTRIAQECGFASQSYFSFAFKRKMEMTPREYTRSMAERYGNG